MKDKAFLNNFLENLKKLINFDDQAEKLIDVKNIILDTKKKMLKL